MATRAPFLTTPFGGYYHRDVPQEDTELTYIGPGTPCGEYLRRFWQPMCFTDDLRDSPAACHALGRGSRRVPRWPGRCGAARIALSPPRHLMLYIATRRVGANIWARMVEIVLPNLQQVAPAWEDGPQVHPFNGPMMSRWIVPQDDTHTMFIEFRHVSETAGVTPSWWADRGVMLPGQLPEGDSYEASQRRPGDYEAQVGQRPIAIHGLEHLGATDRGVILFRQQIR
jgi:hypothetical protein